MNEHIMVIDDDIHIGNMLEEALSSDGYKVSRAYSGTEALMLLSLQKPDLILLDLMLPGFSGEELLPKIAGIPVIIVSAKIDIDNKVDLLLRGAADYITKPFDIKELKARIKVQLRSRQMTSSAAELVYKELKLNTDTHNVTVKGEDIRLTRTEFAILKLLMLNPAQVITKSIILDRISADTPDCTETSLKQHISNLRRKLRSADGNDYIEAVWGIGFKMA
ncbi:response regulator transcription factor [Ruminococcus sp.]|uniref:response regulator transcription factor n=1 Tax=Ruminococcus sp. TaxID=41978 RepID=UPI0025E624DB|nr:response regulator transcription factor [Ruminococcus sp.]MBQ6252685.1 response regulator transcription factor [Ruminococcus sp.]MBR0511809.1 response regulator transcription factor [Ruminococcus sp.]